MRMCIIIPARLPAGGGAAFETASGWCMTLNRTEERSMADE